MRHSCRRHSCRYACRKQSVFQALVLLLLIHVVLIGVVCGLLYFFGSPAHASAEKFLHQGDVMAATKLGSIEADKAKGGPNPFYQGKSQGPGGLHPDVSQMLIESGEQFVIDPLRDPLLKGADPIRDTSLKVIGGQGTQNISVTSGGRDEVVRCEEPGEDSLHVCKSRLHAEVHEEIGDPVHGNWPLNGDGDFARFRHLFWQAQSPQWRVLVAQHINIPLDQMVSAHSTGMNAKSNNGVLEHFYGNVAYSYRPKVKVATTSWQNACGELEKRADLGLCHYVSKKCTQGPETRVFEGVQVHRDCWEETYTYNCAHECEDNCGPLRAKGCVQTRSDCKKWIGKTCVVHTQTYKCQESPKTQPRITGGDTPFCLDGSCRDQSHELNNEMMQAISQLAILKDMQGSFNMPIFRGSTHQCSKNILDFRDCCGSGKGWGVSLGLAGCGEDEKALQVRRQKGLCHFVGTYCAEKVLGQCIRKKTSYCCFGSKLLKAFHVQGRPQIGMRWGDGKNPQCRGFTVDELQRIDFSRLDLREVFEELMQDFQPGKIQNVNQKIQERLEIMKESVRHQDPALKGRAPGQSPQQRGSA